MRLSAKAFLVDPTGRLLLLSCTDPHDPATCWQELPGGGVEPGESDVAALVREVLEETGLRVEPGDVGPVVWTQDSTFTWRGTWHLSRCHGRVVPVGPVGRALRPALTPAEQGSILGQRWWTQDELTAHDGRFFPRHLPSLLPRVLVGERVDEPFDRWN